MVADGLPGSGRGFARRAGRAMLVGISVLLAVVLLFLGVLLALSPGTPKPFLDASGKPLAGSISEKIYVNVNGVRQGMFIKGRDAHNPVLLYLHGGMPDYFLSQDYPTGLDDYFTVVWWEQRGSGLSYSADARPASVNPAQIVSDTIGLTNYLRGRFGQDKIYLMGHSGGTFFGIQAAQRAPELYRAYIGVAQMSNQLESERLAHDYMLRRFKDQGNAKMVKRLESGPVTDSVPLPDSYQSVRDAGMHSLGIGTTHDMKSVATGLLLRSFLNREYTLGEKIAMWRGKIFSGKQLWNAELSKDLTKTVTRVEVPVYFLHGATKGFYTFAKSAHSPFFEEPDRMREVVLNDVLAGSNGLADKE
jgi:pimeloyl-ACP methyl ester carboxylesterase